MLFNSDVFILAFLPIVAAGFFLLSRFRQTDLPLAWLVVASLFFYGWWNPIYVPLMIGSVLINYFLGGRLNRAKTPASKRIYLFTAVGFNLGLLGYFKYANFLVDTANTVGATEFSLAPIVLPLAISFFTFQQIAYIVDVYQDKAQEYSLLHYFLFVTFFPQLIAGPIVHHREMMPQFMASDAGRFRPDNLAVGISLFTLGLIKKVVFADSVAAYATTVFAAADGGAAISFADAWAGALAYTCQIYFDFSGYSDMALGLARIFGIRLPINFNSPYKSTNIVEFWRRWHMTLSRFLRDYLYIPLGGNRHGTSRRYVNLMAVMLLGGLWHGAAWTFVVWGGLHGLYLCVNYFWRAMIGDLGKNSRLAALGYQAITFLAVVVAWVFFRAESFDGAATILTAMSGINGIVLPAQIAAIPLIGDIATNLNALPAEPLLTPAIAWVWIAGLLAIAFTMPNSQQIFRDHMDSEEFLYDRDAVSSWLTGIAWQPTRISGVVFGSLAVFIVMSLWQTSEFLYFQF